MQPPHLASQSLGNRVQRGPSVHSVPGRAPAGKGTDMTFFCHRPWDLVGFRLSGSASWLLLPFTPAAHWPRKLALEYEDHETTVSLHPCCHFARVRRRSCPDGPSR